MNKEATKKFVENNGFICNKCGKVVVDGDKHKNEEDLCDQCKISDLEAKLAESEKSNKYFADRVEKADKEIKEIYKKYNKLVEEYNDLKEEVDNNFIDGQDYNQLKQQLTTQENTINNLIEDNRASQEWYKKQIADTEAQNKRVLEKLELIVRSNQELELALSLVVKTLHKSQGSYCDYCEDANKRICSPLISNCHRHIVNYFKKEAQKQLKEKK